MDSKAIRTIVILGVMAMVAMAFMMMFSLDQMADTKTPQIAAEIAREFAPALATESPAPVKLTMTRDGKSANARRVYRMRVHPNEAVAADERAVPRLLYHCAEFCASELGSVRGEVVIRCTAELPGGAEKEAIFVLDQKSREDGLNAIRAVDSMPPALAAADVAPPADR